MPANSSLRARTSRQSQRRRRLLIEGLEDRRVMATITGGTGPGGFLLTGATSDFILWTRADALSLNNGDAVASWADQSGRGNDLGTPTGPITYVANGSNSVPAVQFGNPATNANGWLQRPALLSNGQNGEVFFMVQTTDANDAQNDGGFYRTGTSSNQHYSWGDNFAYENFGTNTRVDQINVLGAAGGTYNPTNHNIYNVSGVSAGAWAIRLNGETRASKTSNGASTFHAQWYFGKSESPEEWQGQISEIVMLNRALNPAERIIVQNYLHSKYGVIGALTDDRYAGDTPANGNFDREVFGIGRFDASNQAASAGQSGFGIESTSLGSGDYILAGHNVAANNFTTGGIAGTSVTQRWSRSWFVDVTDADDSAGATLAFDYSDAGLAIGQASTFKLLRSTDGGATFVEVGVPASQTGDLITFNLSAAELSTGIYTLGDSAGPTLQMSAGTASYTVGAAAVAIDAALNVNAGGSPNATSATISINGFTNGNVDLLDATVPAHISKSFNATTGVLTLTGADTVANYQTYLRSVTFSKASFQNVPLRSIAFSVTDDAGLTGSASRTILINASAATDNVTWDGNSDGDGDGITFSDPLNWNLDRIPDANDVAVFANADAGPVNVAASTTVGGLSFTSGAGAAFTITADPGVVLTLANATSAVVSNSGSSHTIAAPLRLTGSATVDITGSDFTISGVVSGSLGLTKAGPGILIVSGTNTYTGQTNITSGTLRIGGGTAVVPPPAGATGIYNFDAGNANNTGTSGATNNGNMIGSSVVGGGLIGNAISMPFGSQLLVGSGGIPLGNNWTLAAWWNGLYGTGDWRTLFRSAGAGDDHQIIVQAGANNLGMYSNATGVGFRDNSTGFDITPAMAGWHHLVAVGNVAAGTTSFYVDNVFVGTADRASAGNVTHIGSLNTSQTFASLLDEVYVYTSALTPSQIAQLYNYGLGIGTAVGLNSLPDTSRVIMAPGAFLDLGGVSETIGSLEGSGTVTSSLVGSVTLTTGGDNTSTSFGGVIQNGSGTVGLTKIGAGTQTITSVQTYGGATSIQGGTLQLSGGDNLLPVGTALTLSGSGVLDLNNQSQTVASLNSSSTTTRIVDSANDATFPTLTVNQGPGSSTFAGILGAANQNGFNLTKTGAGSLTLSAANTFTGKIVISGGTLSVNSDAALGTAPGSAVADQITISNNAALATTVTFAINANRGITLGAGGGQLSPSGVGTTYAGVLSGGTGLTKSGTGDLILTGGNLSTPGNIAINSGRLFFDNQNALGTGQININSGGTLDYRTGGPLTLSNNVIIASGGNIASRGTSLTTNAALPTAGTLIINQDDQNTGTVILTSTIALTGALTIQVGNGGGNGGVGRIDGQITGSFGITKTGNGILHLNNPGNSFTGDINVASGTLRASQDGVFGTTAGGVNVAAGATVNFDGAFSYATNEPLRLNGTGVGNAGALTKTNGDGTLGMPISLLGNTSIGASPAATTLTINTNIGINTANLTFEGAGNIVVNGNLAPPTGTTLNNLNSLATGDYNFTAAGQTFSARVDNQAGTGWLLVGRGREGWEFDDDGQGTTAAVNQNLGVPGGFAPAAYSEAIINELLAQAGLTMNNAEIRIRRAENPTASSYQEARWRPTTNLTWEWNFSNPGVDVNSGGFQVNYNIVSGANAGLTQNNITTNDNCCAPNNGAARIFTWAWSGHGSVRGFSYGGDVSTGSLAPTDFLYSNNHSIPYTEIYVRPLNPAGPPANSITKNGSGTLTLAGNNAYTGATRVNAGTLIVGSTTALGTTASGTIVSPGGTLALRGGITLGAGETLTIGGSGAAGQPGALVNLSGNNTIAGNITLGGSEGRIGSVADTLTINGNINLFYSDLAFDGAGAVRVNGQILVDTSSAAAPPLFGVTSELEIWLDASDINGDGTNPANGALVSSWKDKSGKNRNFDIVLSDPSYLTSSTHGRPAVFFDGNDALQLNAAHNPRTFIDGNGEFTMISVARYAGAAHNRIIAARTGHNWLFGFHGNSVRRWHYDNWGSLDVGGAQNDENWHLHANQMNVYSDATNPAGDWYLDGNRITHNGRGTSDAFNNNVPDGLELGGWNGTGEMSTAEVSELIMFNRVLSDVELQIVQQYLAQKYSLAVSTNVVATNDVRKLGAGTLTLAGNNSYGGNTTVAGGTLVAANSNALGTAAKGTIVSAGGTLALSGNITINGESFIVAGTGAAGQPGALIGVSGNNTIGSASAITLSGTTNVGIGSTNDAGTPAVDALNIQGNVNLAFAQLVVDGTGDTNISGSLLTGGTGLANLASLDNLTTGDYVLTVNGQAISVHVDNDGTDSWLLIGRGRDGWEFDANGQKTVAEVNSNLGTPGAFDPAIYSDAIINDLLAQAGINNTNIEMRFRRAANAAGTAWQESRWRAFTNAAYTSVFSAQGIDSSAGGFATTLEIKASSLSAAQTYSGNTRDTGDNDARRIFTWAWSGHAGERGFSYGSSVNLVAGPSATNFLWESAAENHELPYTEVYIRSQNTTPLAAVANTLVKNGTGKLTLAGNNTYTGTTTVNAGVLSVPSVTPTGTSGPLGIGPAAGDSLILAGTFQFTGASGTMSRPIRLAGESRIDVTGAGNLVLATPIAVNGQILTKTGTGTLTLQGGTHAFGRLNIQQGALTLTGSPTVTASEFNLADNISFANPSTSGAFTSTLNIDSGSLTVTQFDIGNNNTGGVTVSGTVNQTGGTVTTTNAAPPDGASLRIGHWPSGTGVYNLSNGTLTVSNNQTLSTAIDGTGTFNQTGGTANAARVAVNSRGGTGGNGTFRVQGGTFNLGSGGMVNEGTGPAVANLGGSGGTIIATAASTSTANISLTGTGANAININTNGNTLNFNGNLSGAGGLTKIGAGVLLLNGTAGTGTGAIAVNVGTLGGTGTTTNPVNVASGATLAPGGTPGAMGTGAVTFVTGAIFAPELNGAAPGTGYDQLRVIGAVTLNGATLSATTSVTPALGQIYRIIDNDGSDVVTGTFNGLAEGAILTLGGLRYYVTYNDPLNRFGTGNDVAIVRNSDVIAQPDNFTVFENTAFSGNVKANDNDRDRDGAITIVSNPTKGTFTSFNLATGAFVYQPNPGTIGADSFTYRMTDGEFTSATVTVNLNIEPVADPPTLTIGNVTGGENSAIQLNIDAKLTDTDGSETLTVEIDNIPADATLSAGSRVGNKVTLNAGQLAGLTLTRPNNLPADAAFTLQVTAIARENANGNTATLTKAMDVKVVNVAPQAVVDDILVNGESIGASSSFSIIPGIGVTFVLFATDPAPGATDAPFTFTINWGAGTPAQPSQQAANQGSASTVSFSYDYAGRPLGTYHPSVTISDDDGGTRVVQLPSITIASAAVVGGSLYVAGSNSSDRIVVQSGGAGVALRLNSKLIGNFSVSDRVIVFGNGGADNITASGSIAIPMEFYGGDGNDYLAGGNASDVLDGGPGADRLLGGNNDDFLYGGPGNDTLSGGNGNDLLDGDSFSDVTADRDAEGRLPLELPDASQQGNDLLNGDSGNDSLYGRGGNDTINGGAGDDFQRGNEGNDGLDGGAGNDLLQGDAGGDRLYGRAGQDVLIGGGGMDTIFGSTGADLIYGGALLDDDDELAKAMAAMWFDFNFDDAVADLMSNADDDTIPDTLHGEGDSDYYITDLLDLFKLASEKKSPNEIFPTF